MASVEYKGVVSRVCVWVMLDERDTSKGGGRKFCVCHTRSHSLIQLHIPLWI